MTPKVPRTAACLVLLLAAAACRKGTAQTSLTVSFVPGSEGTQGCGPSTGALGSVTQVYANAAIGPHSAIAAASAAEIVYLTCEDGSIHELNFTGGLPPVDTVLVAPGEIETAVLLPEITDSALPSGIAVADDQFLLVAEARSNTLLLVTRQAPLDIVLLAGLKLSNGGYSDGVNDQIRFDFTETPPLFVGQDGTIVVGDSENHALRVVLLAPGGDVTAFTLAGTGAPGAETGALADLELDTPSGLATDCNGRLLVLESGMAGLGGNRLSSLNLLSSPFGGFDGTALTLAGDPMFAETTEDVGEAAHLGNPRGLVATMDGLLFFVDAQEGILRRLDLASGLCDCPLFASCASAVTAGGSFTGDSFSLALGASGALYVLEAGSTGSHALYRIDP